jgi:hypothetical protein
MVALFLSLAAAAQSWQSGAGYHFRALENLSAAEPGFTAVPPLQTGVWFTNLLPQNRHVTNTILPSGSGVAAGDIDGDGWCDLFFAGLAGGSRLYRNLGGWRFEDVTKRVGVACPDLDATGATFADLDGDGDLDLIVNSIGGGTRVFLGNAQGQFTPSAGVLNLDRGGMSLALADADGDGDLDLYLANYRITTLMDSPGTRFSARMVDGQPVVTMVDGRPLTDPEWTNRFRFTVEMGEGGRVRFAHEELGQPDVLYLNDGQGRFQAVPWTEGAFVDEEGRPLPQPPFDWGLSVMFRDLTGDGHPDLYVCNDFRSPDRFWINDGAGRFRAASRLTLRQTCLSAMCMDVADLDADGFDDFMVVDMLSRDHRRRLTQRNMVHAELLQTAQITGRPQNPRNMLFMNRGDGSYAEVAQLAGLEATEWSWGLAFLDVDLDGFPDLLVPNGFERDNMNVEAQNRINQARARGRLPNREELVLRRMFPRLTTPNLAFRNLGGFRFSEVSEAWGFNAPAISQGLCLADLDNDGDLDVVLNNMNSVASLYRNHSPAPRIAVRLSGRPPNTQGVGARLRLLSNLPSQSHEVTCGGRYLSGDDTVRVFAVGPGTGPISLEVRWRSGAMTMITNVQRNCLYEAREPDAAIRPPPRVSSVVHPLFNAVDRLLDHVHHDDPFDDFVRQPLLPKRLSQLGPGACWWDINGDGADDLLLGSGAGGALALYENDGQGRFRRLSGAPWNQDATQDQTSIVAWNHGAVLVGTDSYEDAPTESAAVSEYRAGQPRRVAVVHKWDSSAGPMALADYSGDGHPGLFVGGRVLPGRYPAAASSRFYRYQAGEWQLDEPNSKGLREVGLVSGAVWSDLDGDGWPELVLACEWGPLRVFRNERGSLREMTQELGLDRYLGWWHGVTAGDFDGDGKMDLAASNWGRNSKYESYRQQPLRLYYSDLDGSGTLELIEAQFEPSMSAYVPIRMIDTVAKSIPLLALRYPTHQSWAEASIQDILAGLGDSMAFVEANWLESTVFLNRPGQFEARILPFDAQLAPAFGLCVSDFNGDGLEDLFMSQNFFAVQWETSRYDAGRGLCLLGDGQGGFRAMPAQESGIEVYGEQRGAAVADFDRDGRTDLVVTQNSAETRLFRNVGGRPGLRVRLRGPEANPHGIGAVLRLKWGDKTGPAREIHAGSGYWSQDSVVQVLSAPEPPTALWIRWPGGVATTVAVPPDAREVSVYSDGRVSAP